MVHVLLAIDVVIAALSVGAWPTAWAQQPSGLIPREAFAPASRIIDVRVSPDAEYMAILMRGPDDWAIDLKPLAWREPARFSIGDDDVRSFQWAANSEQILIERTEGASAVIEAVDVPGGQRQTLTPADRRAKILGASPFVEDQIMVGLRNEESGVFDLWRVNTRNAQRERTLVNDRGFVDFIFDASLDLRLAVLPDAQGGMTVLSLSDDEEAEWIQFNRWKRDDARLSRPLAMAAEGAIVYFADSSRGDSTDLFAFSRAHDARGVYEPIAERDGADVEEVLFHSVSGRAQLVRFFDDSMPYRAIDAHFEPDLEVIRAAARGDFRIVSRDVQDRHWIVRFERPDGAPSFHHYRRGDRRLSPIGSSYPALALHRLAETRRLDVPVRGGSAPCMLTRSPSASGADPLIVFIHDGPDGRAGGFFLWQNFFADRGYTVLTLNHHGSLGFGTSFLAAGRGELAGLVADEVIDCVLWAIDEGIADPDRVAVIGAGLGGFQALAGLTYTPDFFTAAVAIDGVLDLPAFAASLDDTMPTGRATFLERSGADDNPLLLDSISPMERLGSLRRPILLINHTSHWRRNGEATAAIVDSARANGSIAVSAEAPGRDFDAASPSARLAVLAVVEQFLAKHLGGRAQAVGSTLTDASIHITSVGNEPSSD